MISTRLEIPFSFGAAAAVALLALLSLPAAAAAQDARKVSTRDGVYTAEQAERGEVTFNTFCGTCHATQEFTSAEFRNRISGEEIFWLYDFIRFNMPKYEAGSLPRQMYLDVMAYLLKVQGNPPGQRELPAADEELMRIHFPADTDGSSR